MFLRLTHVVALALLLLSSAAGADDSDTSKGTLVDRVVATVNDEVILQSELARQMAPVSGDLEKIQDMRKRERRRAALMGRVLEEMINEELIIQAASEAQISVGSKEVQAAIDDIKRQNKLDDNQFAEELRKQGFTVQQHRRTVRRSLQRMHAINRLVRQKVSVTDEDIKARYAELGQQSAAVSRVRLQHILLSLPEKPSTEELNKAKELAAEIVNKARSGTSFKDLAAKHSQDPRTKDAGGDLGWIKRNSFDTEWEVIIFAMEKNEVRGPINGPKGLHVFRVSDVEKSERKPFDEVKEKLRNELFQQAMERQTRQWLQEQRKKAHVDVRLQ
jgi:parvulin-like peptidyl-prolyl isomerase